jgi:ribose transport system permease protein
MLGVYGVLFYILKYTSFGRKVYAVGGNPTASYLSGISLNKTRFGAYIISATVAGVAAVLLTSQVSMSLPTAGQGREMDGIAMVILGGVSLTGGKGRVIGTLLGVLIISVLANGMTLLSVPAYYQMLIKGMVLILAVYVDSLRGNKYN